MYIDRFIHFLLEAALKWSPVVLIRGARQTGKTTLVQKLKNQGFHYISFDNFTSLSAAKDDPVGFINELKGKTVLDEIQRVPELFLPIKERVDREKLPGEFVLTGSADPLMLPAMGDSMAGRMRLLSLFPLSEGEKRGRGREVLDFLWDDRFKDRILEKTAKSTGPATWMQGGYPRLFILSPTEKMAWLEDYTGLVLQKDVVDISKIDHLSDMPRLLSLLAARTGGLLQIEELSRSLRLSAATTKRYLHLLEALFLVKLLPAWHGNLSKRLVKSPKIYLNDVALVTFLLGVTAEKAVEEGALFGKLLENFVFNELQKGKSWSETPFDLFHLRDHRGGEVDFILEQRNGDLIALEVKGSETVRPDDFKALKALQQEVVPSFKKGFVIYLGADIVPFGKDLFALPLSYLWS